MPRYRASTRFVRLDKERCIASRVHCIRCVLTAPARQKLCECENTSLICARFRKRHDSLSAYCVTRACASRRALHATRALGETVRQGRRGLFAVANL